MDERPKLAGRAAPEDPQTPRGRVVQCADADEAVRQIRRRGLAVVTFAGYSGSGYARPAEAERRMREQLARFSPSEVVICAGATPDGIGRIYPLAARAGFDTIGIVSSLAQQQHVPFSEAVAVVYVVQDDAWGGAQGDRLSPTSEAMVAACDEMIAIGGGAIAQAELAEAQRRGKRVTRIATDAKPVAGGS